MEPVVAYVNWTAFDELSDNVELTEALAMRQFDELLRLRSAGVRIDAYLMDAFWYEPDSGYRTWRKPHWPSGPDRWLAACREHRVVPGLWVSTNSLRCNLNPHPKWEDSLDRGRTATCMFDGGFLADFLDALQHWYDCGVRLFKFDFARFDAATPNVEQIHPPDEIEALNKAALRTGLHRFRLRNPGARLLAYNGFGGIQDNTSTPFRKTVDVRLLDVFDSLYCGDPIPADLPMVNFWRSVDVYSDHMVRQYERNGVPLERIDNSAFMIGSTAACYWRKLAAWKGMLILSLARGGLVNTYYGNLDLLDDEKSAWFAKVQEIFLPLQSRGRFRMLGGIPGAGEPYGYMATSDAGTLYTMVNPSQSFQTIRLVPDDDRPSLPGQGTRLLFCDAGHRPEVGDGRVTLGPEQMCVIGAGRYDDDKYELGLEQDVGIPESIEPLPVAFEPCGHNEVRAVVSPPPASDLRIVMTQSRGGIAHRTIGAGESARRPLSEVLRIRVRQSDRDVPVRLQYDKLIWSGLSWAAAEVERSSITRGQPVEIVCSSAEARPLELASRAYAVRYAESIRGAR